MELDGVTLEIGFVYAGADGKNKEVWQIGQLVEGGLFEKGLLERAQGQGAGTGQIRRGRLCQGRASGRHRAVEEENAEGNGLKQKLKPKGHPIKAVVDFAAMRKIKKEREGR